jgi:hypothetical protein
MYPWRVEARSKVRMTKLNVYVLAKLNFLDRIG